LMPVALKFSFSAERRSHVVMTSGAASGQKQNKDLTLYN